jgi:hypothetical protein
MPKRSRSSFPASTSNTYSRAEDQPPLHRGSSSSYLPLSSSFSMVASLTFWALAALAGWVGYRKITSLPVTAQAYRDQANEEAQKMRSYSAQSQAAYNDGRRAEAKRVCPPSFCSAHLPLFRCLS